jgi:mono/diheme cytochrome c family protein
MNINSGIDKADHKSHLGTVMRANSSRTETPRPLPSLGGRTAALWLFLFAAGCGTPGAIGSAPSGGLTAQASAPTPERAHIEAVYQSHCGSCHKPVAPGSEPSGRLEAELERHHKRTRLTEAEWAGLDAFLVAGP